MGMKNRVSAEMIGQGQEEKVKHTRRNKAEVEKSTQVTHAM